MDLHWLFEPLFGCLYQIQGLGFLPAFFVVSLGIVLVIFSADERLGCPITETMVFRFHTLPFSGSVS